MQTFSKRYVSANDFLFVRSYNKSNNNNNKSGLVFCLSCRLYLNIILFLYVYIYMYNFFNGLETSQILYQFCYIFAESFFMFESLVQNLIYFAKHSRNILKILCFHSSIVQSSIISSCVVYGTFSCCIRLFHINENLFLIRMSYFQSYVATLDGLFYNIYVLS